MAAWPGANLVLPMLQLRVWLLVPVETPFLRLSEA